MSGGGPRGAPVTLATLLATFPRAGRLDWIGLRPARGAPMREPDAAELADPHGLVGDRYAGRSGERAVTLVQAEHLAAIASLLGRDALAPAELRRNLLVSGINLLALKGRRFRVGDAVLEHTGLCHPCSLMERLLGPGGYNAVRGHGGITARVVSDGAIRLGDALEVVPDDRDGRSHGLGGGGGRGGHVDEPRAGGSRPASEGSASC